MRILVALSSWYPHYTSSSIGKIAYHVSHHLKKRGIYTDICAPIGGDIELINPIYLKLTKNLEPFNHFCRMIYFWMRTINFIKKNYDTYDIFWIHNPNPLVWKFIEKNLLDKIVFTIHTTYSGIVKKSKFKTLKSKIYFYLMKKNEQKFFRIIKPIHNKIIVISPSVVDELIDLGIEKDEIIYIPNGVDTSKFRPLNAKERNKLREKFGIPENKIALLSIGRITESKNPIGLIKTFFLLEKKLPNVFLVIAGKGDLLSKVKGMAKEDSNIKVMGYIKEEDKPYLMSCCDYYITASNYEGQPLALLEALSSGLACVTSQISNLKDIIEEANCGTTVDFNKIEEAADKIAKFLTSNDHKVIGKNARKYIEGHHDWEIIVNRYLEEFIGITKNDNRNAT